MCGLEVARTRRAAGRAAAAAVGVLAAESAAVVAGTGAIE